MNKFQIQSNSQLIFLKSFLTQGKDRSGKSMSPPIRVIIHIKWAQHYRICISPKKKFREKQTEKLKVKFFSFWLVFSTFLYFYRDHCSPFINDRNFSIFNCALLCIYLFGIPMRVKLWNTFPSLCRECVKQTQLNPSERNKNLINHRNINWFMEK